MTVITTTDIVQGAMVTALLGNTAAGTNVFVPRDWPVNPGLLPMLMVQSPKEHKESKGPNAPSYDVLSTIRVIGRLTAKAVPDGQAAAALLTALGALQRQIERAVINNYALFLIISEIVTVDTANEVKSEGGPAVGEITMDFVCKFYQGPECFAPPVVSVWDELAVFGDLVNVYDPNGTYGPIPDGFTYPVEDPPRPSGPDGRVEIGSVIPIPQ